MDTKAILDQAIALVKKANQVGVAVETALEAFKEKLFPTMESGAGVMGAYASCPPELQADILDAVEACSTAE